MKESAKTTEPSPCLKTTEPSPCLRGPYLPCDNKILRVNMANIRRKLEINPAVPKYILTEIGVGYRMAEDEDL